MFGNPETQITMAAAKASSPLLFSQDLSRLSQLAATNHSLSQNLPQFTTLNEIVDRLNLTGPDNNGNFTVFGPSVSANSVQAQVNHANKYLYSLVPGLQQATDPRWSSAELAALDVACLGVLVTSVGGSLVGAYDYFLGDMRVARAGPYASAIKAAIEGYRSSAESNLQM